MKLIEAVKGRLGTGAAGTVVGVVIGLGVSFLSGEDDLDSLLARAKGEPDVLLAAATKKLCALDSSVAQLAAVEQARDRLDVNQDVSVTCTVEETAESAPDSAEIDSVVNSVATQAQKQNQEDEDDGQAEVLDTVADEANGGTTQ